VVPVLRKHLVLEQAIYMDAEGINNLRGRGP